MGCEQKTSASCRVMPPTYFLVALVIVVATRFVLPWLAWATPASLAIGAAVVVTGAALNLGSDAAFKKRGTAVSPDATPSALVSDGVFRVTRNPMYLGMTLILAGAALLAGEPVALVTAAVFAAVMARSFIPVEERNLERAFGADYRAYKTSVRRWV